MKKLLVLILLTIITAAVITPCCLYDDCDADQIAGTDKEENKSEGACSPFFACSSCSGFVKMTRTIELTEVIINTTIHYERIYTDHLQIIYSSFWQPPRLG